MAAPIQLALFAERLTDEQVSFFAALGGRARMAIEPLLVSSYAGLYAAVEVGRAQLAWAPPIVALDLLACRQATPLAVVVRGGRTSFPAVLVARADGDVTRLSEVRGRRVAWVSRLSAAGYVVPRAHLQTAHATPASSLREERFVHSHRGVWQAVREGQVEVGATFARWLPASGSLVLPAGAEGLRVVGVTGFVPNEVIVAGAGLSGLDRLCLGEALRHVTAPELARLGGDLGVERFSLQVDDHLGSLQRLLASSRTVAEESAGRGLDVGPG